MNIIGKIAAGLGLIDGRIDCPRKYREQAERVLKTAETKLGIKYAGRRITLRVLPGTHKVQGRSGRIYWCRKSPDGKADWGAVTTIINRHYQTVEWYTDPSGIETVFESEHEMAECILASVRYPGDTHALMREKGIVA